MVMNDFDWINKFIKNDDLTSCNSVQWLLADPDHRTSVLIEFIWSYLDEDQL